MLIFTSFICFVGSFNCIGLPLPSSLSSLSSALPTAATSSGKTSVIKDKIAGAAGKVIDKIFGSLANQAEKATDNIASSLVKKSGNIIEEKTGIVSKNIMSAAGNEAVVKQLEPETIHHLKQQYPMPQRLFIREVRTR